MKNTNPNFEIKKTSNTLKADHAIHRVTFNPTGHLQLKSFILKSQFQSVKTEILVPGPFPLIFDSAVSGHANSYIVNNVSRALVDRLTVKFAEIIAQNNDVYDLCKLYKDFSLTEDERANMFREVIQSLDL